MTLRDHAISWARSQRPVAPGSVKVGRSSRPGRNSTGPCVLLFAQTHNDGPFLQWRLAKAEPFLAGVGIRGHGGAGRIDECFVEEVVAVVVQSAVFQGACGRRRLQWTQVPRTSDHNGVRSANKNYQHCLLRLNVSDMRTTSNKTVRVPFWCPGDILPVRILCGPRGQGDTTAW